MREMLWMRWKMPSFRHEPQWIPAYRQKNVCLLFLLCGGVWTPSDGRAFKGTRIIQQSHTERLNVHFEFCQGSSHESFVTIPFFIFCISYNVSYSSFKTNCQLSIQKCLYTIQCRRSGPMHPSVDAMRDGLECGDHTWMRRRPVGVSAFSPSFGLVNSSP